MFEEVRLLEDVVGGLSRLSLLTPLHCHISLLKCVSVPCGRVSVSRLALLGSDQLVLSTFLSWERNDSIQGVNV